MIELRDDVVSAGFVSAGFVSAGLVGAGMVGAGEVRTVLDLRLPGSVEGAADSDGFTVEWQLDPAGIGLAEKRAIGGQPCEVPVLASSVEELT